jgi:hypothetical protein
MNYACVYLVAVLVFAMVYWVIRGRAVYTGPIAETVIDDLSESEVVATEKADKGPSA